MEKHKPDLGVTCLVGTLRHNGGSTGTIRIYFQLLFGIHWLI